MSNRTSTTPALCNHQTAPADPAQEALPQYGRRLVTMTTGRPAGLQHSEGATVPAWSASSKPAAAADSGPVPHRTCGRGIGQRRRGPNLAATALQVTSTAEPSRGVSVRVKYRGVGRAGLRRVRDLGVAVRSGP